MNISELSDQEKSVMLARLCKFDDLYVRHVPAEISTSSHPDRWLYENEHDAYDVVIHRTKHENAYGISLYDPANMSLAWRVLNWINDTALSGRFNVWYYGQLWANIGPGPAQNLWLDKVLELAVEAGMVTK